MASDGQIVFEITADGRRAIASVQDITRAIQQETRQWDNAAEQSSSNIESSFSSALKKIAAGFSAAKIGKALLDIGKQAISAASDLEEVQNVVDVTFGEAGAAKIQAWADAAGKQFGLTETQAKKFTSTLGAMMKSAGMSGGEIVEMSTDLAGLAADMASFYNLDFETAFQKIRSGISGETEPLKQLGINMSVANLEAYALSQGITKAFDKMSQGEQTMLRYQYLMQATADAQGDFARTSDGYANSLRLMETNIESLKTKLGQVLIPAMSEAISYLNTFLESFQPTTEKTLMDQVAEIDIQKQKKLDDISAVSAAATELMNLLGELGTSETGKTALATLADGANGLDASSPQHWQALLGALQSIDGLENLFGDNTAAGNVSELAQALSGANLEMDKATAWQTFLGALSSNADALTALTGTSAEETAAWLSEMASAANELDPTDAAAWNGLLDKLLVGIPGLANTDEGQEFLEQLALNFLAMGSDSEAATRGLAALGYSTEEIEQKQATWLATCKELVRTIPGLSDIIDENTGEVKGGLPAIKQYADEWERMAKYEAEIEAIRAKRQVYEESTDPYTLQSDAMIARAKARAKLKLDNVSDEEIDQELGKIDEIIRKYVEAGYKWEEIKRQAFDLKTPLGFDVDAVSSATTANMLASVAGVDPNELVWFNRLTGEAEEAVLAYAEASYTAIQTERERPLVLEDIENSEQAVADAYGVTTEEIEAQTAAAEEAAKSMSTLEKAANGDTDAMNEVTTAVNNANDALKALADHVDETRKKVESGINSTVKSLDKVVSPSQEAQKKSSQLAAKLAELGGRTEKNADEWDKLNSQIEDYNSQTVTGKSITEGLQSQLAFLTQYNHNMEEARKNGVDAGILATLSDGSVESADYLQALADATPEQIAEINRLWGEVQKGKTTLTDTLTEQQLAVDQTYDALVEKAKEAVAAMNLNGEAAEATGQTISGMAEGISSHVSEVSSAVDSILSELNRLNGWGVSIDLGTFGQFNISLGTVDGSHETGLDYVPFDNYLAALHEGESILTAEESRVWRAFKNGGRTSGNVDYDALGGVMRDNVHAGGNVYLDGRTVGQVVSDMQGRSFRALKRSGWQA